MLMTAKKYYYDENGIPKGLCRADKLYRIASLAALQGQAPERGFCDEEFCFSEPYLFHFYTPFEHYNKNPFKLQEKFMPEKDDNKLFVIKAFDILSAFCYT